jgi:hypothetical protein
MDSFYITYKERILAGPMPEEDAEYKLIKLKYCFRNVTMVPEAQVKPKREKDDAEKNERS